MISPVNSDKPINTTTEQSGRSHTDHKTAEAATSASTQQSEAAKADAPTVEVDQARRLFDMENNSIAPPETPLNTAEEARSTLASMLQQIAASPNTAAKAQAANAGSQLATVLQNAPA
ncbi:MAG: hypothetical protein AB2598_18260 [Candidatus Thiodiazotropha sp.]